MAPTTCTSTIPRPVETAAPTVGLDIAVALAEAVVESGFDAHVHPIDLLVADARRRGLSPVLAGIVADRTEPTPVRERALGRLLLHWDAVPDPRPAPDFLSHATIAA